jgi:WD40 repeat protein
MFRKTTEYDFNVLAMENSKIKNLTGHHNPKFCINNDTNKICIFDDNNFYTIEQELCYCSKIFIFDEPNLISITKINLLYLYKFFEDKFILVNEIDFGNPIMDVKLSSNKNKLFIGGWGNCIKMYDTNSWNLIDSIVHKIDYDNENKYNIVNAIALSPDGKYLLSGSNEHTINVFDIYDEKITLCSIINLPKSNDKLYLGQIKQIEFISNELFVCSLIGKNLVVYNLYNERISQIITNKKCVDKFIVLTNDLIACKCIAYAGFTNFNDLKQNENNLNNENIEITFWKLTNYDDDDIIVI